MFADAKQLRSAAQITPWDGRAAPSWEETFDATVGSIIDENLSISMFLNKSGWDDRKSAIRQGVKEGWIPQELIDKYTMAMNAKKPVFNYNELAKELNDERIKTDDQLEEDRKRVLKIRRDYAQDVQARGDASAVIAGSLVGYMSDPINIATVGLSTAAITARSIPALQKILAVGLAEGAISAGSEALIQPLVLQHKRAIDSPYDLEDSIEAIGYAALGGIVFGTGIRGIGEMLAKIRGDVDAVVKSGKTLNTEEAQAYHYVGKLERDLRTMPAVEIDDAAVRREIIEEYRDELVPIAENRLSKKDRKNLESERSALQSQIDYLGGGKRVGKSPTIRQSQKAEMEARIKQIDERLASDDVARKANAELSRLEQGILPKEREDLIETIKTEKLVEAEKQHLVQVQMLRDQFNVPAKSSVPERPKPRVRAGDDAVRAINDIEQVESYQRAMADYDGLEQRVIIGEDGDVRQADEVMESLDKEMSGLDSLKTCINSKVA